MVSAACDFVNLPETISLPRLLGTSGERKFSNEGSRMISGVFRRPAELRLYGEDTLVGVCGPESYVGLLKLCSSASLSDSCQGGCFFVNKV